MGKMKDTTIPDVDQGTCVCDGAGHWVRQGILQAIDAIEHCLSWDDEQLDWDGEPRQVMWKDQAVESLRLLLDRSDL